MVLIKDFTADGLEDLSSLNQVNLLDAIDGLRSQGISQHISLPQIIVCGDQSSGKSSVLEAISGVAFPVKSNLCTRFPTELSLRKSNHTGAKVTIVPHHSRTDFEKNSLSAFDERLDVFDNLPDLIEQAKVAMGLVSNGPAFSRDLLRIEITGPERPQLTIVDLPGLIHAENQHQSASDVQLIADMVKSYMKEPRSIILAVVSAKNDIANQVVLKFARETDKEGARTLGVITKPDTLHPGSESENTYISLVKNHNIQFRLGWHVLRNRDTDKETWTLEERDQCEADFFACRRAWGALSPTLRGIKSLRARLSELLLRQIVLELPNLIAEISEKRMISQTQLEQLGEPRKDSSDQRAYLTRISHDFGSLVQSAVSGSYEEPFFDKPESTSGYEKRFRAVIQNIDRDFGSSLRERGRKYKLCDASLDGPLSANFMLRTDFVKKIVELIERTRGRELPGMYNPMIVSDLFKEQSAPWVGITDGHIEKLVEATQAFLRHLTLFVADANTALGLLDKIILPYVKSLQTRLKAKVHDIFHPLRNSHPITYNSMFKETLQAYRHKREEERVSRIMKTSIGVGILQGTYSVQIGELFKQLTLSENKTLDERAASDAADCLEAYYIVSLERFIDDVAVEVVEVCLISQLRDVLNPLIVSRMSDDEVAFISGETEESQNLRKELQHKLNIFQSGIDMFKKFSNDSSHGLGLKKDGSGIRGLDTSSDSDPEHATKPVQSVPSSSVDSFDFPLPSAAAEIMESMTRDKGVLEDEWSKESEPLAEDDFFSSASKKDKIRKSKKRI